MVRLDHEHRHWEYSQILRQLRVYFESRSPKILDTGSGASHFPLYLRTLGYDVEESDSCDYGDPVEPLRQQCSLFGVTIPFYRLPVQNLSEIPARAYDATLCISVIEHVEPSQFEKALFELYRVTKRGGLVCITSDFFETEERSQQSPFRSIQHTIFTPFNIERVAKILPWEFCGGTDFKYRGDFVNNYSFVNMCLRVL